MFRLVAKEAVEGQYMAAQARREIDEALAAAA